MEKCLAAAVAGLLVDTTPALADSVADFYRGKQIRVIVRTTPATDYDEYSRLIARFMGKHIPGNPSMIVVNMPGGGGITAANYFTQIAPHDGTVMGIVSQGLAADQALGMSPQLKADLRDFNWIANVIFSNQLLAVWHTSPTKTLEDAKKRVTTIGTTGAGSASVQYPAFYNNVLGTKFKIVFGYPGGNDIDLAMERGEVEGRGTNPVLVLHGVASGLDPEEAPPPAGSVRRRKGAGIAGRAADQPSCRQSRTTSRCSNSWRAPRP